MNRNFSISKRLIFVCLLPALLLAVGCTRNVKIPQGAMDTPGHHVNSGKILMEQGAVDRALVEFRRALELDPKFAAAHRESGLAYGLKGDYGAAFVSMKAAKKYSGNAGAKAQAHIGFMRLYTHQQAKNWLPKVEGEFGRSMGYDRDIPDAFYFMGAAYRQAGNYKRAGKNFIKVLEINGAYTARADQQLAAIQKAVRAIPGSGSRNRIAGQGAITRAETASLLVQELKLNRIFKKEMDLAADRQDGPGDISGHALETDVRLVLAMGIRGLERDPQGNFRPNAGITRAHYAIIIGDIVAKLTRDPGLNTRYIGQLSPFPDVKPDAACFNAVLVCTTRGIMEVENSLTGKFNPAGAVGGADALLVIRKLKDD